MIKPPQTRIQLPPPTTQPPPHGRIPQDLVQSYKHIFCVDSALTGIKSMHFAKLTLICDYHFEDLHYIISQRIPQRSCTQSLLLSECFPVNLTSDKNACPILFISASSSRPLTIGLLLYTASSSLLFISCYSSPQVTNSLPFIFCLIIQLLVSSSVIDFSPRQFSVSAFICLVLRPSISYVKHIPLIPTSF
jgi:hypothetical protein